MTETALSRRRWLVAAAGLAAAPLWCAQPLVPHLDNGRLRVSNPGFRLLEGAALERLHNGAAVIFSLQLSLYADPRSAPLARSAARFAVSYDLWEERFAATRLGTPRRSRSHMTAAEAEAWCLENLDLPAVGLSPDSAFWLRLDVRPEDPEDGPPPGEDLGLTLARLVELFTRPPRPGEARRRMEAGPFRLKDLR